MSIIWRKEMSVANTLIDEDHRYLFCLANTVELALRAKETQDILDLALDQLLEYTEYHFAREEALQYKIQYPKYEEHKAEHRRIVLEVRALRKRLDEALKSPDCSAQPVPQDAAAPPDEARQTADATEGSGENSAASSAPVETRSTKDELDPAQLLALIRHWVLDHILKRDREMIPYLERHPANYC